MDEYKLDNRVAADVRERIAELAKCYTPEWKVDYLKPDIGATLAILYAKQMDENIRFYNDTIERCHIEFINMLGLSLMPSQPSSSIVVFGLIKDTIDGAFVPKNSKLLADAEQRVIFETQKPMYITNAGISDIFMIHGKTGVIKKITGKIQRQELLDVQKADDDNVMNSIFTSSDTETKGFSLFRFNEREIERNVVLLYHSHIFDVEGQNIYLKIDGNTELVKDILDGKYAVSYFTGKEFEPVTRVLKGDDDNTVILQKYFQCAKVSREKEYSCIAIEAKEHITENISVDSISFSSSGDLHPVDFAGNGNSDFNVNEFMPFGNMPTLYKEFYFGHEEYFSKKGSRITVRFNVKFEEFVSRMSLEKENDELKIIKRKPRAIYNESIADSYIDEITIEYFNGMGWKRLETDSDIRKMFALAESRDYEFSFEVPWDWEENVELGHRSHMLRMKILRCDNCYSSPCIYHYPVIMDMQVKYTYNSRFMKPEMAQRITGTCRMDISKEFMEDSPIELFMRNPVEKTTMFLGFDRKIDNGPIGIYFEIAEDRHFSGSNFEFEYSTAKGFRLLKVEDYTGRMTRSGIVRFMLPEDFATFTVEGVERYWIRMVDIDGAFDSGKGYFPYIKHIYLNAVEVLNVESHQRENYYIDEVVPNMRFGLSHNDIYDIELWVNEIGSISKEEINYYLSERSDECEAVYDLWGNIREFYIKWSEKENFYLSDSNDRHYVLDRMSSTVMFGDGVHVKIPRVTNSIAFFTKVKTSNGIWGNVDKGKINDTISYLRFVDSIKNVTPAFGGCNIETVEGALRRGTNIIGSRKRLITMQDYVREIKSISDTIEQVSCVLDRNADGTYTESAINFVILLKKYRETSLAFERLAPQIEKHLLEHCEHTIAPEKIRIVEPVLVRISVDVWLKNELQRDDIEIKELFTQSLDEFLDPIASKNNPGWKIGSIPRKKQILTKVSRMDLKFKIYKIVITAKYTDTYGVHECDIEALENNPYFVCTSGEHTIHFIQK